MTDPIVKGSVFIDTSIVKREDLERVLDAELKGFRKDMLKACLKRYERSE